MQRKLKIQRKVIDQLNEELKSLNKKVVIMEQPNIITKNEIVELILTEFTC